MPLAPARPARRRAYFVLMGSCVLLILLAWNLVRLWSTPAAVAMSVVAAILAPVAVIIGNAGALEGSDLPSDHDGPAGDGDQDEDGARNEAYHWR